MNKKFSTLVASLLLSSAFSVYAGNAKPMLATPTQVETRATSANVEVAEEFTGVLPNYSGAVNYAGHVLKSGFTNNSRIAYIGEAGATPTAEQYVFVNIAGNQFHISAGGYNPNEASDYYWTLGEGELVANNGAKFAPQRLDDYVEVVPVKQNGKATEFFAIARRNADGSRSYVKWNTSSYFEWSEPTINTASLFISVETAFSSINELNGAEVNSLLGDGFNLFVSSARDENATISKADVFSGKLSAMADNKTDLATTSDADYYLKNADGKFIVFEQNGDITSDLEAIKGEFKLVDANSAGNPTTATTDKIYNQFVFISADNGSGLVEVRMGAKSYRLYNARVNDTYALTLAYYQNNSIDAADWAVTSFNLGNLVDLREFLTGQFYTVDFVKSMDSPADANDEYKKGGRLAIRENGTTDYADYVDASGLFTSAPEAQWAVSATTTDGVNDGKPYFNNVITLTNRENPDVTVTINTLRRAEDGSGFVVVSGSSVGAPANTGLCVNDVVRITAVANHDKHDGYEVFNDNDLRNETYHLGQLRQTADGDVNVYWAENHDASHQIGATVDEAKATRWNLSLVKKANAGNDYVGQTDSILIVSELQNWVAANKRIETKKDTLVILPYAFQNRSNSEFAEFNDGTNLNYYQCNVYDQNEQKVYKYGTDAMFALKRKADVNGQRVYNYVMLNAKSADDYTKGAVNATTDAYATYKVYQENSTDRGTWKNMQMYAGDANALMFVTKVKAPEYRKLVTTANLDTIKLYRADNEAQVVYEKKDTKASTLLERPVSFLNIDNVEQFKDINPALYADTAYVNRGNNTRYQYLLGVNIEHKEGWYCDEHGFTETPPCKHAVPVSYNQGRYLINMIDTANILAADLKVSIHNNPFINETEEGNQCAKLAFVDAIHVLTDSVDMTKADKLYVINNEEDRTKYSVIDLSTPDFNVAKFAFKYTDSMVDDNFKIQTLWKEYNPAKAQGKHDVHENGYLRWVNGCLVVDDEYAKGDVFNMNEDETRTPTANEEITAEGSVVVAGVNGAVVVKGAEGKSVIVSTILGKVVANEVLTSDNATIAAPAGVVVVSVDGESFKVVVK